MVFIQASRLRSPGKTLKRRYDEVMGDLEVWKRKREARMREHDEIQAQVNEMRESLGQPVLSAKAMKGSITKSNIDFLKLELEKMRAEKVRKTTQASCHIPLSGRFSVMSWKDWCHPCVPSNILHRAHLSSVDEQNVL